MRWGSHRAARSEASVGRSPSVKSWYAAAPRAPFSGGRPRPRGGALAVETGRRAGTDRHVVDGRDSVTKQSYRPRPPDDLWVQHVAVLRTNRRARSRPQPRLARSGGSGAAPAPGKGSSGRGPCLGEAVLGGVRVRPRLVLRRQVRSLLAARAVHRRGVAGAAARAGGARAGGRAGASGNRMSESGWSLAV